MKTTLLAAMLLALAAHANDRLRDAQAELKSQGFYFGEVDGRSGSETTAAIRRFQIRNGLKVTGELNDETTRSLGIGLEDTPQPSPAPEPPAPRPAQIAPPPPAARQPAPAAPPIPAPEIEEPPIKRAKDFLRESAETAAPRPTPRFPNDPAIVDPPVPVPSPAMDDFSTFYHGTPYSTAPREVQTDVLRKAQTQLARRGLYRAVADGIPGPATADALFLFQEQRRLRRTGRLDMPTLAELDLLPGRGPDAPPLRPFYDPNRRRDRSVDMNSMRRL